MAKKTDLSEIHERALRIFNNIQSVVKDERIQCLQDRRFYSIPGAQWEGWLADQFENKPMFEVNKIHLSVIRIFNDYRNNRITVNYISRDGNENGQLADTCDGLYRADEQDSVAEEAYDNAFEEAVGGGFGAWRLRAEYEDEEDEENEHQRIRIEPIFDADSTVFFDLGAKRQDKSDASRCFVLTSMAKDAFIEEYDEDPATWPKDITQAEFDWSNDDVVFVAEYYEKQQESETIRIFKMLDGEEEKYSATDFENDEELEANLFAVGAEEVRTRKIKRTRVRKYIMSGGGILEDCGYIAGKNIPIVPVYGKRWFVDNVERCMGHVRLAKDAQRLKNMQLSKLGELSALSPVQKPIVTPEQISGHNTMWEQDNIKNYPYLLLNQITDMNGNIMPGGPVGYTQPPQIAPAMAAILQTIETDMQDVLGNQAAGEQMHSNISEGAIQLVQNSLGMQTFIYMSNMSKAIKRSGEIWLSMASELFVERGRKMKTIGAQDEIGSVELGRPIMDMKTSEVRYENDLSDAKFDVSVDVGPSSSSRRSATVKALMGMLQVTQDAETQQVLGSMIMMNMEGEGVANVRDYFRKKLIRLGVVKPTEQEGQELLEELQNQKPDANTTYLEAAAKEAEAKATKAGADTVKVLAESEKTQAQTAEIIAGMDIDERDSAIRLAKSMKEAVSNGNAEQQPQNKI